MASQRFGKLYSSHASRLSNWTYDIPLFIPSPDNIKRDTDLRRLVATIGSKSNTKKVTRKAILDVDVRKACETIIEPEVPLALRLQSNLL